MEALARLPSASSLLSLLIAHDDESTEAENGFWYHPVESRSSLKVAAQEGFVPDSIPVIEDYSDDDDSMIGMDIDVDNDDNGARSARSSLVPPASVLPCHVVPIGNTFSSILPTLAVDTGSPLLDMLPDEITTNLLSYLTIADVRAFANSCQHAKKMIYENHTVAATRHLWHSLSRQAWGLLAQFDDKDNTHDKQPKQRVIFRDDLLTFGNHASQPKLAHLTGLTAKSHPVQLSSSSFQGSDSDNGRIRQQLQHEENRTLLRRLMQQRPPSHEDFRHYAMPFTPRTSDNTSNDMRSFSITSTPQDTKMGPARGEVKVSTPLSQKLVPVVQFVGGVGSGDRCVRSIEPFPRPRAQSVVTKRAPPPGYVVGTRKPMLGTLREMMSEFEVDPSSDDGTMSGSMHRDGSNSTLSSGGQSTSKNAMFPARTLMRMIRKTGIFRRMVPASSLFQRETVLRPFVSPFVSKTVDAVPGEGTPQVVEMNVTPRMVAYYELSILPRHEEKEERPRTVFEPQQATQPAPAPAASVPAAQPPNQRAPPGPPAAPAPAPNGVNNEERPPARECIALGVSKSDFPLWGRMPGWDGESYGYHGDDGGIFHGRGDMVKRFGPSYGEGDTVGCGVDYVHKAIFFTLNGEFLGYAWTDLPDVEDKTEWFPTVGVDSNCPLSFNFGDRPFAFDLAEFCGRHAKASRVALRKCVGTNV